MIADGRAFVCDEREIDNRVIDSLKPRAMTLTVPVVTISFDPEVSGGRAAKGGNRTSRVFDLDSDSPFVAGRSRNV